MLRRYTTLFRSPFSSPFWKPSFCHCSAKVMMSSSAAGMVPRTAWRKASQSSRLGEHVVERSGDQDALSKAPERRLVGGIEPGRLGRRYRPELRLAFLKQTPALLVALPI